MRRLTWPRASGAFAGALTLLAVLALAGCAGAGAPQRGATSGAARQPAATHAPASTPVTLAGAWKVSASPIAAEALRFAPSNPSVAYLCADNGPADAPLTSTPQLYSSVQGKGWSLIPHAPVVRPVPDAATVAASCDIFIDAQNPQDIFLQEAEVDLQGAGHIIAQELARSRDGGATWSALTPVANGAGFANIAVVGPRLIGRIMPIVYGGVPCNPAGPAPAATTLLYASDDGGATWNPIGQSIEAAGYSAQEMVTAGATLFAIASHVPTAACQQSPGAALWRSSDGGVSWVMSSLQEPIIQSARFTPQASGTGYYGIAIAQTGASGSHIALFSPDSGASWTLEPPLPTSATAGFVNAAVTAQGELVTQADGAAYVYTCPGASAATQWTPFAPGSQSMSDNWRVQPTAHGARIWSLQYTFSPTPQASTLAYLSLP